MFVEKVNDISIVDSICKHLHLEPIYRHSEKVFTICPLLHFSRLVNGTLCLGKGLQRLYTGYSVKLCDNGGKVTKVSRKHHPLYSWFNFRGRKSITKIHMGCPGMLFNITYIIGLNPVNSFSHANIMCDTGH